MGGLGRGMPDLGHTRGHAKSTGYNERPCLREEGGILLKTLPSWVGRARQVRPSTKWNGLECESDKV
jgi:hypothetical protein